MKLPSEYDDATKARTDDTTRNNGWKLHSNPIRTYVMADYISNNNNILWRGDAKLCVEHAPFLNNKRLIGWDVCIEVAML